LNDRQTKILSLFQWIFYPVAVLMVVAFVADALGDERKWTETVWGAVDRTVDPFAILVLGIFFVVLAALIWQFLIIELSRARQGRKLGKPLIAIYPQRFATRFVWPLGALLAVAGVNAILFASGTSDLNPAGWDIEPLLAFIFFYITAHFLLIAFALRAFRNRPFFIATDEGFIYEPGDVSPGLIQWGAISKGAEAALLTSGSSNIGGPRTALTIVLSLEDPGSVFAAYNPLLRSINALAARLTKYQSGGIGDIVLAAEDFGPRYGEVRALIRSKLAARWSDQLPD
jgi:NADH:ubiquinone oxidoreductase subunit 6 (subunit J)